MNNKAFSLVELLVVVGIIALLVAILLPALNRAKQPPITYLGTITGKNQVLDSDGDTHYHVTIKAENTNETTDYDVSSAFFAIMDVGQMFKVHAHGNTLDSLDPYAPPISHPEENKPKGEIDY